MPVSHPHKFLLAAMVALLPVFPGQAAEPVPALKPIVIGYPQANYWPLYVARDLKLFERVGLAPTFKTFTTGAPLIAEMVEGGIDVAWTGLATVPMLDRGVPMKFVLVTIDTSSQMSMVVHPRSGITSYKDVLKARAIGGPRRTCAEVSATLAVKKAGGDITALNFSNLPANLLLGAMQKGEIDTAFIWGPWDTLMRDAGFRIVGTDKDFAPEGSVCATTMVVRNEVLEKLPGVGCKLVKVHALALEAARKDPEVAILAIQESQGISRQLAKESYETLVIPSIKSQLERNAVWSMVNETGGLTSKLQTAADALYEAKSLKNSLSRETIWRAIDAQYIRKFLETDCK